MRIVYWARLQLAKSQIIEAVQAVPGVELQVTTSLEETLAALPGAQGLVLVNGPPIPEVIQHAREGKLRMLATTTSARTRFTPEVPTMKELGYDVVFQDWSGLVAPAKTSRDIVVRANAAVADVIRTPAVANALVNIGVEADLNSPEEFAALHRSTWERYREVVKATGFTPEE